MIIQISKMYLAKNLIISRGLIQRISRCLSNKSLDRKRLPNSADNGPSLKDFIKNATSNNSSLSGDTQKIDPIVEIENKIFLDNVKRLNEQVDVDVDQKPVKKAVFFEVHGCQMNVNDTEVAYSILSQTG